nr:hypothetical protein [Deltaproteobacteria bacterium]
MRGIYPFVAAFLVIGIVMLARPAENRAEIQLSDTLSLSGYVRYELGLHAAEQNPNNAALYDDNNDINLARSFFQTEITYKPSSVFKLFANVRFSADQTAQWDGDIDDYNAYPVDVPDDDWTMMKVSEDEWRAEVWELYGDIRHGNAWFRMGRQQIVWGEMIGARILDAINPIDQSWNFLFEPEEFENIRIPQWSIRGSYNIQQNLLSWLSDLNVEGFVTPGDVLSNQRAESGAPFNLMAFPPFFRIDEQDNRGSTEYGGRIGGLIGQVYGTLNYIHSYNDDFSLDFTGLTPDPILGVPLRASAGDMTRYAMLLDAEHKAIDLYGMSLNYAFGEPFNAVMTFEGAWVPNQPYGKAGSAQPEIEDQGTLNYAVRFDRPTQVVPKSFYAASFMTIQLQFKQTVVEGDEDDILGPNNSRIDKTVNNITLQLKQPLLHNDLNLTFQTVYDTDSAYMIKPWVQYKRGDHWYFDVFGVFLGGSEDRPGRFGSLYWADTVYGRVTYQF